MSKIKLSKEFIKSTVKLALNEDLYPSGDITSDLINKEKVLTVKLSIIGCIKFTITVSQDLLVGKNSDRVNTIHHSLNQANRPI